MKYIIKRFGVLLIGLIFLTACGSKVSVSDYIELNFEGYDTIGMAYYSIDDDGLIEDAFGVTEEDYWEMNHEEVQEINDFMMSYTIELDQDYDLANGDEVTVRITVDEEMTNKLSAEEEVVFEVTGLEEPTELSDEEIDRNVIVNFNGVSGLGSVMIDTTFDGDLYDLYFEAEQDGTVANGDTVTVSLTEESRNSLAHMGYALSGTGAVEFEASGLKVVAEDASEIENLADIERMIDEGINRRYQDNSWGRYSYDIVEGESYYRQFDQVEDEWGSSSDHGALITLYTINELDSDGELTTSFTAIQGFNNIVLDQDGMTNVTQISEYTDSYDDTYSLESVEKMMEGYGYELVE